MAQLLVNTARNYRSTKMPVGELGVAASAVIYRGSAVGVNGNFARQLAPGDSFIGFADGPANNLTGAAGDVSVRHVEEGFIELQVVGATAASLGAPVNATTGNDFTLAAGVLIGEVNAFLGGLSGEDCIVSFKSEHVA